jgi:hypothetical protein
MVPEASRSRIDSRGIANWQQLRASSLLDDPTPGFDKILCTDGKIYHVSSIVSMCTAVTLYSGVLTK